jgi:hypothetical protein
LAIEEDIYPRLKLGKTQDRQGEDIDIITNI